MIDDELTVAERILFAIRHDDAAELSRLFAANPTLKTIDLDQEGLTPLHVAARDGKIKAAKALLDLGYDANKMNDSLQTPLCLAAEENRRDMIELLLANGARADYRTDGGHSELPYSVVDEKTAEFLLEKGMPLRGGSFSSPATHVHYSKNRLNMVRFFIRKGISVNDRPGNLGTLLHRAARNGDAAFVKELLDEHHANLNVEDHNGITPAYEAGILGRLDVFNILAERGGKWGGTLAGMPLLVYASLRGRAAIVERLLDLGENVEQQDHLGRTALLASCYYMDDINVDVAKLLVARGADLTAKDRDGRTAKMIAGENGQKALAEFLEGAEERQKEEAARKSRAANLLKLDRILKKPKL